jgi:hypothetical protein
VPEIADCVGYFDQSSIPEELQLISCVAYLNDAEIGKGTVFFRMVSFSAISPWSSLFAQLLK